MKEFPCWDGAELSLVQGCLAHGHVALRARQSAEFCWDQMLPSLLPVPCHSCFLCDKANNADRSDVVGTMITVFLCSFLRALLAVSELSCCTVVYLNRLLKNWGGNRMFLCRCHKGTGGAV